MQNKSSLFVGTIVGFAAFLSLSSSGPGVLLAGELRVDARPMPTSGFVGEPYEIVFKLINESSTHSLGKVSSNVKIEDLQKNTVIFVKEGPKVTIDQSQTVTMTYPGPWLPKAPGLYRATITATSYANTTGIQRATVDITVGGGECEDPPVLTPGSILYLDGSTEGTFTWSVADQACCYEIRSNIVSGRGAMTIEPLGDPVVVSGGSSSDWSVSVDRERVEGTLLIRFDWRECDGDKQGQVYALVKLGSAPPPPTTEGGSEPELPPGTTGGNGHAGNEGDPVNTFLGEFYFTAPPDIGLHGAGAFLFSRSYASNLSDASAAASDMGRNWTHNFSFRIISGSSEVMLMTPSGKSVRFYADGSGGWKQDWQRSTVYRLVTTPGGYEVFNRTTGTSIRFDATGAPISIHRSGTAPLLLSWSSDGSFSVTNGRDTLKAIADANGRIVQVRDSYRSVRYSYDGFLLTEVTDVLGNRWMYEYDEGNPEGALLTGVITPEGPTGLALQYDSKGRVANQTDEKGNRWTFNYENAAVDGTRWTRVDGPDGEIEHLYDRRGNLLRAVVDGNNGPELTYDSFGRKTSLVDRRGKRTEWEFDEISGMLALRRNPDGSVIRYDYEPHDRDGSTFYDLAGISWPDDSESSHTYDTEGRLVMKSTPGGEVWRYEYDAVGRVIGRIDPDGRVTQSSYDPDGNLVEIATPRRQVEFSYDTLGRLEHMLELPDSGRRSYTYYPDGRLQKYIRDGLELSYVYDRNGRLSEQSTSGVGTKRYSYDGLGRLESYVDPAGETHRFTYGTDGRPTGYSGPTIDSMYLASGPDGSRDLWIDPGSGNPWSIRFDPSGLPIWIDSGALTLATDALGRVASTTGGLELGYDYDTLGLLRSFDEPLFGGFELERNQNGAVSILNFGGGVSSFSFEYDGSFLSEIEDPRGNVWKTNYDTTGLLAGITDPLGGPVDFEYTGGDPSRIRFGDDIEWKIERGMGGRIESISYSDGDTASFSYDGIGRVVETRELKLGYDTLGLLQTMNGITYDYDATGRLNRLHYSGGETVTYSWGEDGKIESITDWMGRTFLFLFSEDEETNVIKRPNGTTTEMEWEGAELRSIREYRESNAFASIFLGDYDRGLPGTITRDLPHSAVPGLDSAVEYDWDAAGRRTDAEYADGLLTKVDGYMVDVSHSLRLKGISWQTEVGDRDIDIEYDGLGSAIQFSDNMEGESQLRLGLPFGVGRILEREQDDKRDIYIYDPRGRPIACVSEGGGALYLHFDERGNTAFLTDDGGDVVESWGYLPTGEIADGTSDDFPFRILGSMGYVTFGGLIALDPYGGNARSMASGTTITPSAGSDSYLKPRIGYGYRWAGQGANLQVTPSGAQQSPWYGASESWQFNMMRALLPFFQTEQAFSRLATLVKMAPWMTGAELYDRLSMMHHVLADALTSPHQRLDVPGTLESAKNGGSDAAPPGEGTLPPENDKQPEGLGLSPAVDDSEIDEEDDQDWPPGWGPMPPLDDGEDLGPEETGSPDPEETMGLWGLLFELLQIDRPEPSLDLHPPLPQLDPEDSIVPELTVITVWL